MKLSEAAAATGREIGFQTARRQHPAVDVSCDTSVMTDVHL